MGQSRQTETRSMPAFQEEYLRETLLPFATNISEGGFTPFTGERVAGVSDTSMRAVPEFERISNIAGMTPADYASMTEANMSPFQSQVIDAALARGQRERDIARTGDQAQITRAGAFGNERRGVFEAERQAAFDIGQQQMVANLLQQGYTQAQAATMAQLGQTSDAASRAAEGFRSIGGLEQVTDQARLDAAFDEFMRELNLPYQQLDALTAAASGVPSGYGTNTQTYRPGVLDYLTAGASAYSTMPK